MKMVPSTPPCTAVCSGTASRLLRDKHALGGPAARRPHPALPATRTTHGAAAATGPRPTRPARLPAPSAPHAAKPSRQLEKKRKRKNGACPRSAAPALRAAPQPRATAARPPAPRPPPAAARARRRAASGTYRAPKLWRGAPERNPEKKLCCKRFGRTQACFRARAKDFCHTTSMICMRSCGLVH